MNYPEINVNKINNIESDYKIKVFSDRKVEKKKI